MLRILDHRTLDHTNSNMFLSVVDQKYKVDTNNIPTYLKNYEKLLDAFYGLPWPIKDVWIYGWTHFLIDPHLIELYIH